MKTFAQYLDEHYNRYGFLKPSGEYIEAGHDAKSHEDLARSLGFKGSRSSSGTGATNDAIRAGLIRHHFNDDEDDKYHSYEYRPSVKAHHAVLNHLGQEADRNDQVYIDLVHSDHSIPRAVYGKATDVKRQLHQLAQKS